MKIVNKTFTMLMVLLVFWAQASAQKDITYISISNPGPTAKEQMLNKEGFSTHRSSEVQVPLVHRAVDSWIDVGDGSSPWGSYNYPIDFFWNTTLSQSIYTGEGINHGSCAIEEIKYIYQTVSDDYPDVIDTEPIKVWLANTNATSISEEDGFWIPFDQFTLVYDGTPTLTSGEGQELVFSLIEPFIYNGSNLCIMVERVLSENSFLNHFTFTASTLDEGDVRARLYGSYDTSFDFDILLDTLESNMDAVGMTLNTIADVSLGINTLEDGSLTGTITNTDAGNIAEAKVTIDGTDLVTYSAEDGTYSFPFLLPGNLTVSISAFGYVSTAITVEVSGATTQDAVLNYLPKGTVEGTVLDNEDAPISGATVQISGYDAYQGLTNDMGVFSIADVYYSEDYEIAFSQTGYSTEQFALTVDAATVSIPTVNLTDILDCPSKVEAVKVDDNAEITWLSPYDRTVYRRDGGELITQLGHNFMEDLAVFGQVFREPAQLYQMSWYTTFQDESHDFVSLFVFALDANGNPTNTILYEHANAPNVDDQWSKFIFPDTITVENGFYIAVSYRGRLDIGIDAGADPQYPYVNGVNWVSENYLTNEFSLMENLGLGEIPGNFMIRAEGYNPNTGEKLQNLFSENPKALNTYKVHRLKVGDELETAQWDLIGENIPETQTALTDAGLVSLEPGWYKYAIVAVYSDELESEAAFSNAVEHGLTTQVTFSITTNTPTNESNGTVVTLTSTDGEYAYSKTVETDDGILVFNDVFKGVYNVMIEHERFEDISATSVDLTEHATYELEYELTEMLTMPANLTVTVNEDLSAVLKWNYTADIFEDFEGCEDFAINPQGAVGWNYIDLDMRPTVGINNFEYLNENAPHAFMAFNPTATEPPVDLDLNPGIAPFSGDKYLASFGVDFGQNDDYLISPKLNFEGKFTLLFWAKSFDTDPAPNKIRVGFSKTGNQPEDFTWLTDEPMEVSAVKWTEYVYSLDSDVKYVAINNVSDGGYILMIDDVELIGGDLTKAKEFVSYEVYLNGDNMGTTKNNFFGFSQEDMIEGDNVAGVIAVYDSGSSDMATITFNIVGSSVSEDMAQAQMSIYPNPSNGTFNISLDGEYEVKIVNTIGALVYSKNVVNNDVIDLGNIASGVYVVTAKSDTKFAVKRIVIK